MKKLFTLFAAMVTTISMMATTIDLDIATIAKNNSWADATKYTTLPTGDNNITITAKGGGNTGKYYNNGTNWRFYQSESASLVITAADGYSITAVTFTFTSKNTATLLYEGTACSSGTAVTTNSNTLEFAVGNSGSATNGQILFTNISITYDATTGVAAPTISADNKQFLDKATISMSAKDSLSIYYTLDGTDPTTTSTLYTAPFDVTATTTIKAIASDGTQNSSIASLNVTKCEQIGVTEARARITAGTHGACYVKGIVSSDFFGNNWPGYANIWMRDIVNDTDTLEAYKCYNGIARAEFATMPDLNIGDTILVFADDLTLYAQKSIYETTGGYLAAVYPSAAPAVKKPSIYASKLTFEDSTVVTITCATEGASIYYTLDGTDPSAASTLYTDSLVLNATTTIKAIAILGEDASEIVTKTVTKASYMTIAEVNAQPVGTNVTFLAQVVEVASTGAMLGDATGYIYYYNNGTKLVKGQNIRISGAVSTNSSQSFRGPKQMTYSATIDTLGISSVTDPTPEIWDGQAIQEWATNPIVKYIKVEGKLIKSGNYYNIEFENAGNNKGSLLAPKYSVESLVDQTVVITGYAVCITGTVYANIMATSVVAKASAETKISFNSADVIASESDNISFNLTGANASLVITEYEPSIAYNTKEMAGSYDVTIAPLPFELTVEGAAITLTEGNLSVAYIDCNADRSQNKYEFKLDAYTADMHRYYSCDTIWTTVTDDNEANYPLVNDNINVDATSAYNIASKLDANEVTEVAYNIYGYLVSITNNEKYYVSSDASAKTGFMAYKPSIKGTTPVVGDYVHVYGKMTNYSGNTPETSGNSTIEKFDQANLPILRPTETIDTISVTISEAIIIGNALEEGASTPEYYKVTGFVTSAYAPSTDAGKEGQQTWFMAEVQGDTVKANGIMIQSTYPDREVVEGDQMTIIGKITNYKSQSGNMHISFINANAKHEDPTAIENVWATEQKAVKTLEKGMIIIRRNGEKFLIDGRKL